jgi:mannose-6-phosphate isomerase
MPLADFLTWMRDDALPVWLAQGVNNDLGLFWEKLHLDGRPDTRSVLRSRTQARQIYVYARSAELGLIEPETSLVTASRTADRFHQLAWAPDGRPGWVHRLKADGTVADPRRDLYDHAFVLLGLTWLAKATGEERFATWVDETLDYIDRHLTSAQGGWLESDLNELPRRQNPHMHLFEASLALFETTGDLRHLTRADAIVSLFHRHFFDRKAKLLREFFGAAWESDPDLGWHRIESGHHMEWCWLLRRYSRCRDVDVDDICETLFSSARDLGLDLASGFLIDETDDLGRKLVAQRRLWPQTEYLKALIEQGTSFGDPGLINSAHDLADRLLATYLSETPRGTWRDQFDLDGKLTADHIPASTLYHLLTAAAEILRLQQSL